MKFTELPLQGAYLIELHKYEDVRGYFARTYCKEEFSKHGILCEFVQTNISFNTRRGTIRGMHYQLEPFAEPKIVSCYAGAIYDVIIDLRTDSKTYCEWFGIELNDSNNLSLYIPKGFAHGFQTLGDNVLIHYHMGEYYNPSYARGIRWNDPLFDIRWPILEPVISQKDSQYPDFKK